MISGVGNDLWRIQVAVGGVVALAIILIRFSVAEESAFWLASRGELHAAASVIEKAFYIKTVVETAEARQTRPQARYLDILHGAYLPRTILATEVNLFQSIVYFAVGFYLPLTVGALFRDPAIALLGTAAINVAGLIGGTCAAVFANRVGLRRQTIFGFGLEVPILVILGIGVVGAEWRGHRSGNGQQAATRTQPAGLLLPPFNICMDSDFSTNRCVGT